MTGNLHIDAFMFGIISAISLPLGAVVAFFWIPRSRVVASLMAFGAGALLAALTIDLVAVAIDKGHFPTMALGAIVGGVFFFILNQIVNSKGGFLRKTGSSIVHLRLLKLRKLKHLTRKISKIPLFHHLPPEEMHNIVHYIHQRHYKKGKYIIHHDDPADLLIILEKGEVKLIDEDTNETIEAVKEKVLGEVELLTGNPHKYSIIATTNVTAFIIYKHDFDELVAKYDNLALEVEVLANEKIHLLEQNHLITHEKADEWYRKSLLFLDDKHTAINHNDMNEAMAKHAGGGAAIAIWLGILLDGIPESIVIGSNLLLHSTISLSLLAGLFLSNFPEALSSSVGLRQQKFSRGKILIMWSTIMIATGIGAIMGNVFFENVSPEMFALVDGMAAGAMLTMIAETMLPEAFHLGGSVTGLSTLAGFLVTLSCKFI